MAQHYKDLIAWQKAMDLVDLVYRLTDKFPKREVYSLTDQIRRAAVSIPSNIAEGHGRSTSAYLYHLSVSGGSLRETETDLIIANRVGFSKLETHLALLQRADEVGRLLSGLTRGVEESPKRRRP